MEKMKMHSMSKVDENVKKIAALFPECITEIINDNGELEKVVDIDAFRQLFSKTAIEGSQERYQFTWPDKRKAKALVNQEVTSTLRPCREESVNFDTTENLYIEGDNLEVLKLLQETYLGKIKMIYIDPPYNTGHDFVYEDDFSQKSDEYVSNSGQYDNQGNRLVTNTESNGRFHTDWLNMIYPRLRLAKDLLSADGAIFISIDDNEQGNLRKVCDEVFGEQNFVTNIIWQKKYTRANDARWFSDNHDFILCYAKDKNLFEMNLLPRNESQLDAYSNPDNDERGPWKATPLHAKSGSNTNPYTFSNGIVWRPPVGTYRRFSDQTMKELEQNNEIWFGDNGNQIPSRKSFLSEVKSGVTPVTIWPYDEVGHNHEANNELKQLDLGGLFTNPKPTRLLNRIIQLACDKSSYILDFFSGSATTAHAVMKLNAEDGGHRKFIMVQLPENCDEKSEACKAGYKNICEIGKERIRRASKQIINEMKSKNGELFAKEPTLDIGFRDLKLDSSNMNNVYYNPDDITQAILDNAVDNIKSDRSAGDLLFQVMLDLGVLLSAKITEEDIGGKKVFNVGDNYLIACFDEDVDENVIMEAAKKKPTYFVMRDSSIANDSVSVNFDQIFARYSPDTVRKVL